MGRQVKVRYCLLYLFQRCMSSGFIDLEYCNLQYHKYWVELSWGNLNIYLINNKFNHFHIATQTHVFTFFFYYNICVSVLYMQILLIKFIMVSSFQLMLIGTKQAVHEPWATRSSMHCIILKPQTYTCISVISPYWDFLSQSLQKEATGWLVYI